MVEAIKKNIPDKIENNVDVGFIMLRHMSDNVSKNYYKFSYKHIRKYYPEHRIVIIDDHSKPKFVEKGYENKLYKTQVIYSEYPPGRGELLPYLYYIKNNFFKTAVILHDSAFLNKHINFDTTDYAFLWHFSSTFCSQDQDQRSLIQALDNNKAIRELYPKKQKWKGCFGAMTVITHEYLIKINNKYNLFKLVNKIKNRHNRMSFERIIACVLQSEIPGKSLFGNIINYRRKLPHRNIRFQDIVNSNIDRYKKLPILKVWSGR